MDSNLRQWRKLNNINAVTLANILNISVKHYYDLETGRKRINEDYLKILAENFQVSPNYILGIEKTPMIGVNTENVNVNDLKEYLNDKLSLKVEIEKIIKQLEDLKTKL